MITPDDLAAAFLTAWDAMPGVATHIPAGLHRDRAPETAGSPTSTTNLAAPYATFTVVQSGPSETLNGSDDYLARFRVTVAAYADQRSPDDVTAPAAVARAALAVAALRPDQFALRAGRVDDLVMVDPGTEVDPTMRNSVDVAVTRFAVEFLVSGDRRDV